MVRSAAARSDDAASPTPVRRSRAVKVVEAVEDDIETTPAEAPAPRRGRTKAAPAEPAAPKGKAGPKLDSADEPDADEEDLEDLEVIEIEDLEVELEAVVEDAEEETPSIVAALSGATEKSVSFTREGNDVVLTVGG